jgi:hypothetical protein
MSANPCENDSQTESERTETLADGQTDHDPIPLAPVVLSLYALEHGS